VYKFDNYYFRFGKPARIMHGQVKVYITKRQ
jgi:hypothetical protein